METVAVPYTDEHRGRDLALWQLIVFVLVYLAIIQGLGRVIGAGISSDDAFATTKNILESVLIPIALSAVFAVALATWLGWWPQIIHEPRRVQRWVRIVPLTLLFVAVVGASWANLFDQKIGVVVCLVVLVIIVGFTEELMFRGISLITFRRMGMTEARVALYSSLLFGAVHLTNALATGASAIFQAAIVSFSGYMFYMTRRYTGLIWPAMVVHGSQDFLVTSGQVGIDAAPSKLSFIVLPAMIFLAVLLWHRRHRIEPEPTAAA